MDRVGTQGWYFVAFSASLGRGEVRSVRRFGAQWVLQRARSGHVRLVGGRDADQPALPTLERLGSVWAWYGLGNPAPFAAVPEATPDRYVSQPGAIHHADGDYRKVLEHLVSSHRCAGAGRTVITVIGPGTAVWRVLDPAGEPRRMVVLTVTPVEPGDTLVAWRTLVRTPSENCAEFDVVDAAAVH